MNHQPPTTTTLTSPTAIIPLDPSAPQPIPFKPHTISDLLRTQYCLPGSVFLVERIDSHAVLPSSSSSSSSSSRRSRRRAVRLLLSDGELAVQALLAPEMHGFVDGGEVFAGCFVRCDRFELRVVERGKGTGMGKGKGKEEGKGKAEKMVYLLVEDLRTVGWNSVFVGMVEEQQEEEQAEEAEGWDDEDVAVIDEDAEEEEHKKDVEGKLGVSGVLETEKDPDAVNPKNMATRTPARPIVEPTTNTSRTVRFQSPALEPSANKKTPHRPLTTGSISTTRTTPQTPVTPTPRLISKIPVLTWPTSNTSQPLKLTALAQIPHLPYKQNWLLNTLCVITWLSPLEPSALPPQLQPAAAPEEQWYQRSARLADPSTSKRVLLNVFLDPDEFTPAVGSVVLLTGVKNHWFDGGSVKKYVSDRPRVEGMRWWWEEGAVMREMEWCRKEVRGLRGWWKRERRREAGGREG